MNDDLDDLLLAGAWRVLQLPPPRAGLRERILAAGVPGSVPPPAAPRRSRRPLVVTMLGASLLVAAWMLWQGESGPRVRRCHAACVEITGDDARPFELGVGEIALRIAGTVRIDFLPWPDDHDQDHTTMDLPRLRTFLRDHATTPFFSLAVLAGHVTILGQQPVEIGAGERRRIDQPVARDSALAGAIRAEWARVVAGEDNGAMTVDELAAALVWRMVCHPGLFALIHDDLHRRFLAAERDGELAQRLLPFVVFDPAPWSERLRDLLLTSDDPAVLLAASERGLASARERLLARYLQQDPEDGEWLAVAAHLAAVGAEVDPARLRRTLLPGLERDHGLEPTVLVRTLTAALALRTLGDGAPLAALQQEATTAIDRLLREENAVDAAALFAVVQWFAEHGITGRSQSLAWDLAVNQAVAARSREVPAADVLRRELERLRWR